MSRFILLGLCLAFLLSACGAPASPTPTSEIALTQPPTPTRAPTRLPSTHTPNPTETSQPTPRPTQTQVARPTITATPCVDEARFVNETVPDNTGVAAGATFEKSWLLENTGTCIWDTGYQIQMNPGGGLALAHSAPVKLSTRVPPGERVGVAVTLTAPLQAGTYRSDFLLVNNQEASFGIGASGQTPIYVQVVVDASATPVSAATSQPGCTYRATFISETVPDNTRMFPGDTFWKEWTVKNSGTCTWTDVNLPWINAGGLHGMPGLPADGNPEGNVPPGGTRTFEKPIVAPQAPGTYRADFHIGSSGTTFGLGQNGETPLYVQIVVVDVPTPLNASDLSLGEPTWHDLFDRNEFRWALEEASNANVTFAIESGALVMDIQQGRGYWTVGSMPESRGQVHQAVFQTGETCAGQNSYGLLVGLNPNNQSGAFANGYRFRFTCDGQYSVDYVNPSSEPNIVVDRTPNAALRSGPNQTNRMLVVSLEGKLSLYANDVKIFELKNGNATQYENGAVTHEFTPYLSPCDIYCWLPYNSPGRPGLFISGEAGPFTVRVDEYTFWNLDHLVNSQ